MCWLCQFVGDPDLFVSKLKTKLGNDGLSISPEQRDALLKIFEEIKKKIPVDVCYWRQCLLFEDTTECVLYKKYKEFETCEIQKDDIDWIQVERKLRQFLLDYETAESDELRFGLKSITWIKVLTTHEGSISETIRNYLQKCEKAFRRFGLDCYRDYIRYTRLGQKVLAMETVNWDDIQKSLKQINDACNMDNTAKHPDYATKTDRLASYSTWPDTSRQTPEVLADAGFFYSGCGDGVLCFYCGVGLRKLEAGDDPWIEHVRSSDCNFVKQKKGEEFVKLFKLYSQDNEADPGERQGITVEDLDGREFIIYKKLSYKNDVDYLVNQVANKTGISKKAFILVYGEIIVVPGKHMYIPVGAKLRLLPLENDEKPPTNLTTFVIGMFNGLYGKIDRLFSYFPNVFEDTTRLLSEKDFVRICQLIGKGWGMLGIELGLTKVKLQQIKEDKQNVVSRIFEMLSQWSQIRKDEATAGQLLSAIMKSGVSCEFDKLKRALLIDL